ncbi:hypothetical protein [Salinicoccus roseus]|uniref:Uncharacterized protein n=1 Tax=Salinicoccus roseus TaxID=45670 RepID=A0ABT4YL04_9STAP|nr:hypothetical protein [Salinicoccus roseus]MDB0581397.1 hypothetical protein [Salinicoccus roseus]
MKKNTKSVLKKVDINGKLIDEKIVKPPEDLARQCLKIACEERTHVD